MQKLYRSQADKILFGVCGGLGEYFEIDPVLVRLAFILFSLVGGGGVLIYIILAVVIPRNPAHAIEVDRNERIKDFAHKAGERVQEFAGEVARGAKVVVDSTREERRARRRNFFGILLIVLGFAFLFDQLMPAFWPARRMFWPVLLILVGLFFVFKQKSEDATVDKKNEEHVNHGAK